MKSFLNLFQNCFSWEQKDLENHERAVNTEYGQIFNKLMHTFLPFPFQRIHYVYGGMYL